MQGAGASLAPSRSVDICRSEQITLISSLLSALIQSDYFYWENKVNLTKRRYVGFTSDRHLWLSTCSVHQGTAVRAQHSGGMTWHTGVCGQSHL